jgi:hypothetical protein
LDYPYLATSPDGIFDDDTLIEVKCPYGARESFISLKRYFKSALLEKKNSRHEHGVKFGGKNKAFYFLLRAHHLFHGGLCT